MDGCFPFFRLFHWRSFGQCRGDAYWSFVPGSLPSSVRASAAIRPGAGAGVPSRPLLRPLNLQD